MWQRYGEIYRRCMRDGDKAFRAATEFYAENREAMERGTRVTDPQFFVSGIEISALQHAWDLRFRMGEQAYFAQIENRPENEGITLYDISAKLVAGRVNRLRRRECEDDAQGVTVFSDVGYDKLRWCAVAWSAQGVARVCDYGQYPERGIIARKNMPDAQQTERVQAALAGFCDEVRKMVFAKRNGQGVRVVAVGFDRSFATRIVQPFCSSRSTAYPFPLLAVRGVAETKWRDGNRNAVRAAECAQLVRGEGAIGGEYLVSEVDRLKEIVQRAFLDEPGRPGSCSIWGTDPRSHGDFAASVCAETLADKGRGANGTEWWKWVLRPGERNHHFDALVGCYALANFYGIMRVAAAVDDEGVGNAQRRRARVRMRRTPVVPLEAGYR